MPRTTATEENAMTAEFDANVLRDLYRARPIDDREETPMTYDELDHQYIRNPHRREALCLTCGRGAMAHVTPALELCNACDLRPMEPGDAAGYCAECHDDAGERQDRMAAQ